MRSGAWLVLLGVLELTACSGGYPLPPTRCDEYCDATKGGFCQDYYQPAGCVADCETANTDVEECRATFDAVVSCFRSHPDALTQRCEYDVLPDDCSVESIALSNCVTAQAQGPGFGR